MSISSLSTYIFRITWLSMMHMNIKLQQHKSLILHYLEIWIFKSCNLPLVGSLSRTSRRIVTTPFNLVAWLLVLFSRKSTSHITRHWISNVIKQGERVATEKLYSDTPAINTSSTCCQIFVGRNTDVVDIYLMKFSKHLVNMLKDNVLCSGGPTQLVSDHAQVKISGNALRFFHVYGISAWQSDPPVIH